MFSSLLSKTSKKPMTMVRIEPSNSKSDDSECYQHLRTLRSKLHDFNSTLKKIHFNVGTLPRTHDINMLANLYDVLNVQTTALLDDMQLEEARINSLMPRGNVASGRRRKATRRRRKH
jgi:hypothetical protein